MKSSAFTRQIDKLGRIVIPSSIRNNLNIKENDSLEIISENDRIVLRKYEPGCIFCGSFSSSVIYEDKIVCKNCIEKLASNNI